MKGLDTVIGPNGMVLIPRESIKTDWEVELAVINTGTPDGLALGLPDHPYLGSGDMMELWIDGQGRQRQELGAP